MMPIIGNRTININFGGDLVAFHHTELERLGYCLDGLSDEVMLRTYSKVLRRRPSQKPRIVLKSRDFSCPPEHSSGLLEIENIVSNGGDISPHLTKTVLDGGSKDRMLDHWDIHHLHLGTRLTGDFVERTGLLLFCRFDDEYAYFIDVMPHGSWTKQKLIKVLHENWPESIATFRLDGVVGLTSEITDEDVMQLRQSNVVTPIQIEEGVVYLGMGLGTTTNGVNINDLRYSDYWLAAAKNAQQCVVDNFKEIEKMANAQGKFFGNAVTFNLTAIVYGRFVVKERNSGYTFYALRTG